jgi:hypothetical protein
MWVWVWLCVSVGVGGRGRGRGEQEEGATASYFRYSPARREASGRPFHHHLLSMVRCQRCNRPATIHPSIVHLGTISSPPAIAHPRLATGDACLTMACPDSALPQLCLHLG